jgi:hypothetical protein
MHEKATTYEIYGSSSLINQRSAAYWKEVEKLVIDNISGRNEYNTLQMLRKIICQPTISNCLYENQQKYTKSNRNIQKNSKQKLIINAKPKINCHWKNRSDLASSKLFPTKPMYSIYKMSP